MLGWGLRLWASSAALELTKLQTDVVQYLHAMLEVVGVVLEVQALLRKVLLVVVPVQVEGQEALVYHTTSLGSP